MRCSMQIKSEILREIGGSRAEGCSGQNENAGRLEFRHASCHLSQRRPGFYLILLRNENRHRSLKEKPSLIS